MRKILSIFIVAVFLFAFAVTGVAAQPMPIPEIKLLTQLSTESGILVPKASDKELSDIIQNKVTEMESLVLLLTGNSLEYLIDPTLSDEENIAFITIDIQDMLEDDSYEPGDKSLDEVLKDYFKYSILVEFDVDYDIAGKTLEEIMIDYYKLTLGALLDVDFGDEVFSTTADFFKRVAYKVVQMIIEEEYDIVLENDLNPDNIVGIILSLYKTKGNLIDGIFDYNLDLQDYDENILKFDFLTIDELPLESEPVSALKTLNPLVSAPLVESMWVNGVKIDLSKTAFEVPVNEGMNKIEIILKSTVDPNRAGETYTINANISRTKSETTATTTATIKDSLNPSLGESSAVMKVVALFGLVLALAIVLIVKKKKESQ